MEEKLGNLFQNIKKAEDRVREEKIIFESNQDPSTRSALLLSQANFKNFLKVEEEYLREKSHLGSKRVKVRPRYFMHQLRKDRGKYSSIK